ncbi:hypothetical protein ACFFGR_06485 [Arthrobacter liuii]|uniref:hypothetical protein n=1 Tax=Arthrobacter liuii TaxID=1476996 RepID=UPI0035E6CE37
MANAVMEAFGKAVASLGTLWVHIGTPNLTGSGSSTSSIAAGSAAPNAGNITTVLGYVMWISLAVAVLSLFILGALIATRVRAGEGIAAVGRVGLILGAVVFISGASALVSGLMPSGPSNAGGAVLFIQSGLWWYMGAAAVVSVIIGGVRMVWDQRAEPGRETVKSLLTLVVVAGAGVTIVGLLVAAADSFSVWILDKSLNCSVTAGSSCFGGNMLKLLALTTNPATGGLGPLLVIVLGVLAILAAAFQIVLMVARGGMLVILAGILPLAASFTNTEMGKSWFRKCIGWLVAFILYKPAAAIVYAAAFQLAGTDVFADDGTGLLAVLTGLMLMMIALFAMPALMRFVTPMVGAMAGGAGGALAVGALAALPSGAAAVGRLASGSGSGSNGSSGSNGQQGSQGPSGGHGGGDSATQGAQSSGAQQTGGGGTGAGAASAGATRGAGAGAASAGGGAGAAAGGAAGGAAAGGGAAAAGAAAGPVGIAAGAAMEAGKKAGQAAAAAAQSVGEQSTGEGGGPDGSR